MDNYKNFAYTTVATAPSPAASGTSIVAVDGSVLPAHPFNATIYPNSSIPSVDNAEIVRVTNRSGNTLTVTRTQEGTSARSIIAGDIILATVTAKTLTDLDTGGAPTTVDYLVGTADAGLSAEIVVGTTPGGELGGTWGSPTIDATHSGSSHASIQSAAEATAQAALDAHTGDTTDAHDASAISVVPAGGISSTNVQTALQELDSDISAGGIPATIVDSKGDIIVASAADTVVRLPVSGNNGRVLTENSAASNGIEWAVASGGGTSDPVADTLGDPDTTFEFDTSSLTGLTAIGTPDVENADTTIPGHYYIRDDGSAWVGRYASSLTAPFTVIGKVGDAHPMFQDGKKVGVFVGDASPALSSDADVLLVGNAGNGVWVELASASNISNDYGSLATPYYLAIRVNSSSNVDYLFSFSGLIWKMLVDSRNPGIGTIVTAGIVIAPNSGVTAAAFDYLRIWNSAITLPGAIA